MFSFDEVQSFDAEVASAMEQELGRQRSHIELIASENFVSKAVMAAMGSPLTNKYAEGYPGKRYYGGCDCVDVVENLAIERAKELLESKRDLLENMSNLLLEEETIYAEEVDMIMQDKTLEEILADMDERDKKRAEMDLYPTGI